MKGLIRDLDENLDDEVMRYFQCVLSSSFLDTLFAQIIRPKFLCPPF